ncbi:hypothetical protein [Nitrosomonas sp.]|uniref:hypothetical protein n=1 Tax=Nitrosomonas sp. TaxID=42353 RepID=UPI001DCE66CA|nr:hypothetical protein [Nitrosomonas sp.]MBX3617230.1 hypothetical protein [Nitrosomonas sp.]
MKRNHRIERPADIRTIADRCLGHKPVVRRDDAISQVTAPPVKAALLQVTQPLPL